MVRPKESFLELFRRHTTRPVDHMLSVIFGPVPIEDAAGRVVAIEECRPWQGRKDVEIGQFHLGLGEKLHGSLEYRFVIVIEPEDNPWIHHNAVIMKHLDLL